MKKENSRSWLPILISFKLVLRLLAFVGLPFFLISMLNIALFSELPERSVRIYLFFMPIWEFYLLLGFRKDEPPLKLLLAYFLTAAVFEFPSTLVGVLFGEFPLHALLLLPIVLPWYLSTLLGLVITLKLLFRRS